ncbi:hypothetical protein F5Y16DRAFT_391961 [Xylariaceae sp. FL0255]|nr:hypothetical protein F5Y16DRAFT_391961 [Xylariaceae sp. FL0255]
MNLSRLLRTYILRTLARPQTSDHVCYPPNKAINSRQTLSNVSITYPQPVRRRPSVTSRFSYAVSTAAERSDRDLPPSET